MTAPLRIIGIDPGTRHVGYGVVDAAGTRLVRVAAGTIHARDDELSARLGKLFAGLTAVFAEFSPHAAAVETVFVGDNIRTAITIGEARGMALTAAARAGVAVTGYPPAVVKRAVAGSGRAGKEQIRSMMRVLLDLDALPATDHEADALALAATHALRSREQYRMELPPTVRRQLAAVATRTLPDAVRRQLAAATAGARGGPPGAARHRR